MNLRSILSAFVFITSTITFSAILAGCDDTNAFAPAGDSAGKSSLTQTASTRIGAGLTYSVALRSDGTVWTWGANIHFELGDPALQSDQIRYTPGQVEDLDSIIAVAAGVFHTLALRDNGTVRAWGYNGKGQLGNGGTADTGKPAQVSGLTDVVAVAAGASHSVALKSDGTVWTWGYNGSGQLGTGLATGLDNYTTVPAQVPGLTNVTTIAAGEYHTAAIESDGTLWTWGRNSNGELGDGTRTDRTTPVKVGSDFTDVAAGIYHTLAIDTDGAVLEWGDSRYGTPGDETTTIHTTPQKLVGLNNIASVAAGGLHSVAMHTSGIIWGWGQNDDGEVGDGTTITRYVPTQIAGIDGIAAIAAGWTHTVVIKSDGTLWAWGSNIGGILGDGTTTARYTPVRVLGESGVGYFDIN